MCRSYLSLWLESWLSGKREVVLLTASVFVRDEKRTIGVLKDVIL